MWRIIQYLDRCGFLHVIKSIDSSVCFLAFQLSPVEKFLMGKSEMYSQSNLQVLLIPIVKTVLRLDEIDEEVEKIAVRFSLLGFRRTCRFD